MSHVTLASMTNQKLDAARRFIQLRQEGDEDWLSNGFEGAAIFHLKCAVNGLLQEIREAYRLSVDLDIRVMADEAAQKHIIVPALNELLNLYKQKNSWFSQLEEAYVVQLECRPSYSSVLASQDLIGRGSDAGASVSYYLSELVGLVLRFREESSEY